MYVSPFQISLETLMGVAPMLGHTLEDRSDIRDRQEWSLVQWLQSRSSTRLRDESQRHLFCVAPFDVVVSKSGDERRFHILELNGTGIGGLTNLTAHAISAVLDDLRAFAEELPVAEPLILVPSSGLESPQQPRRNKLIHEKVLYAEALKRGLDYSGRPARVTTMTHLLQSGRLAPHQPTIVVGYMKEFLTNLHRDAAGRLFLFDRQVHAALNDRFCMNVLQRFGPQLDLDEFRPLNRCFLAGADKGFAYTLLDDFLTRSPRSLLPARSMHQASAHNRADLIATVLERVRRGRKTVIKPRGTGLGHGIEFFVRPDEPAAALVARIDGSLRKTEEMYGLEGGALPYTVCDFIDGVTIEQPDHPLRGHKYELRIVVYREGLHLKAFPSIAKIASEAYDAERPTPLSLLNNITASAEAKHRPGVQFMLPLANRATLETLGVCLEELLELCEAATSFVRDTLDRVQDEPALFGLPAHEAALR